MNEREWTADESKQRASVAGYKPGASVPLWILSGRVRCLTGCAERSTKPLAPTEPPVTFTAGHIFPVKSCLRIHAR